VRTNLLQMQLDALLDEVCVDYTAAATKPLDDYLCARRAAGKWSLYWTAKRDMSTLNV
jgi:hypothetical protein